MPSVFKVQEHWLQSSYIREYPRSLADPSDSDLRLAVKQYTPLDNPAPHDGDITIVGGHANGFPKASRSALMNGKEADREAGVV